MNKLLLSCIAALSLSCQSNAVRDLEEYRLSLPKTNFSTTNNSIENLIVNEQTIEELIKKNNGVLIAHYNLEASKARYELQSSDYGIKSFLKIVPSRNADEGNYSNRETIDFSIQQDFPFGGNLEIVNREKFVEEKDNELVLRFSLPLPFSNKASQRRLTIIRQMHELNRANNEYIKQLRNKHREVKENLYEFNYRVSLVGIQNEFILELQIINSIISETNTEQALKEYKTDSAEAQNEIESRNSKETNAEISLKSSLGISIDSKLDFISPKYVEENFEKEVERKVIELDPDLNTLASQSLVAKEQLKTSNIGRSPDVYFTGEYGRNLTREKENWGVGLGIELNLFDSGKNKALQKEGENILQATNLGIEQRINELSSSTKRELLNISEAKQRYLNSSEIVSNAKASYSGALELLKENKTSYSETRRLLEKYRDGQDDLNKSLRDYLQAKARLEIMTGRVD